jgi:hypothetical protein
MRWEGTEVMVGGLVGAVNLEDWHWSCLVLAPTPIQSQKSGQKATPSESPKQIQKFPPQNNSSRIPMKKVLGDSKTGCVIQTSTRLAAKANHRREKKANSSGNFIKFSGEI